MNARQQQVAEQLAALECREVGHSWAMSTMMCDRCGVKHERAAEGILRAANPRKPPKVTIDGQEVLLQSFEITMDARGTHEVTLTATVPKRLPPF